MSGVRDGSIASVFTGCAGLFGFSPQDMRVYIDNIKVTAN